MILPRNMVQLPNYKDFFIVLGTLRCLPCLQLLCKSPTLQSFIPVLYLPSKRGFGGHWDSQIPSYVSHHLFLIHPPLLALGSYSTAVEMCS